MASVHRLESGTPKPRKRQHHLGLPSGLRFDLHQLVNRCTESVPNQNDPQLQQLQNAVNQATIALNGAQSTAFANYSNFVLSSHSTETFIQWLQNEGIPYSTTVTNAQALLTNAQNTLSGYMASKASAVQTAVTAYKNGLGYVTNPITNTPTQVAGWATSEFAYDYVNTITQNNPGGRATAGNAASFTISEASDTYDYQHTWAARKPDLPGSLSSERGKDSGRRFLPSRFQAATR